MADMFRTFGYTQVTPADDPVQMMGLALHKREEMKKRYIQLAVEVERLWRASNVSQRTICFMTARNGIYRTHYDDETCLDGNTRFCPEWNLHDMVCQGPEPYLALLKYRFSTTIEQQVTGGIVDGTADGKGDKQWIMEHRPELADSESQSYGKLYNLLKRGVDWSYPVCYQGGDSKEDYLAFMRLMSPSSEFILGENVAGAVLLRQLIIVDGISAVMNCLLSVGKYIIENEPDQGWLQQGEAAKAAFSQLAAMAKPWYPKLAELVETASQYSSQCLQYVEQIGSDDVCFAHEVRLKLLTGDETIIDPPERLPAGLELSNSYGAVLDAVQGVVKRAAIAHYIEALLHRLTTALKEAPNDKPYHRAIRQELAEVCYLDFFRAQKLLRRYVQRRVCYGWMYGMAGELDIFGDKTIFVTKPSNLMALTLRCVINVCHQDTEAKSSMGWLGQLINYREGNIEARDDLTDWEMDAVAELAVSAVRAVNLERALSLPQPSTFPMRSNGFTRRCLALEAELNKLRPRLNELPLVLHSSVLGDREIFTNLREDKPQSTEEALEALEEFIEKEKKKSLANLYDEVIGDSLSDLDGAVARRRNSLIADTLSLIGGPPSPKKTIEPPAAKVKTRPLFDLTPDLGDNQNAADREPTPPPEARIRVSQESYDTFAALFRHADRAYGQMTWNKVTSAMAEVGFGLEPCRTGGSAYIFTPPQFMMPAPMLRTHRPHPPVYYGYAHHALGRRLARNYGWTIDTFEVA